MWEKEMETAQHAATEAGRILKELYGNVSSVSKKGKIDLVTEADLASEKAVIDAISRDFPDDMILAEESGKTGEKSGRLWIVDPLDGTTNFAHSFPFFGVSIALQAENEIIAGVVYNPVLDEFFEAEKGKGAFLNKKSIRVSDKVNLRDSLIGTGFPYDVYEDPGPTLSYLKKVIVKAQGIRRAGAAAVDLCYVAAGRLDGFWEQGLKPWDTAAGTIVLQEAGGILSDYEGNPYNPFMDTVLASTPGIHSKMLEVFAHS